MLICRMSKTGESAKIFVVSSLISRTMTEILTDAAAGLKNEVLADAVDDIRTSAFIGTSARWMQAMMSNTVTGRVSTKATRVMSIPKSGVMSLR